jgi:hypothetical protein
VAYVPIISSPAWAKLKQPRRRHQRSADGQHLLLAAREKPGPFVASVVQEREQLVHARPGPGFGDAVPATEPADAEVLVHRQAREDPPSLGDLHHALADDRRRRLPVEALSIELDGAPVDRSIDAAQIARHGPQQGRLARAVAPQQRDDAAAGNVDRDAPECPHGAAIADLEAPHRQHGVRMRG